MYSRYKIFEGGTQGWEPPCNNDIYSAEIDAFTAQATEGTLQELANGYRFVFDPLDSGDRYFSGIVPVEQYTWHFANRQVPIAHPNRSAFSHDMAHTPGYIRMFAHSAYADLVQQAAANSVGDPELCKAFAHAHDSFADQMLFLYRDDGYELVANYPRMFVYLSTLVGLAQMNSGYQGEEARQRHMATFNTLTEAFQLAEYEHWYDTVDERYEVL